MDPLKRAKSLLLGSTVILIAIGVIMIYSASAIYALDTMKDSTYFLTRHLLYLVIGGVISWQISKIDYQAGRKHAKKIIIGSVIFLILVYVPHIGYATKGAHRWIRIAGFSIQPSEFLKIAMIYYMADFLDRRKAELADLKRTVLPALFVLGMCLALVLKQPDLGTTVTVAMVVFIMFFAAGFPLRYLGVIFVTAIPVLAGLVLAKAYRRKRLLAFLNPWEDPRGVGFQIIQSFLALGSGGLFGVGLGQSQQKLFYLPESHTDFIFSIIGEELGFVGASSVILLFIVFLFAGMVIVFRSKTFFSQLLSLGLVSLIGFETVINIGVSIGALPTKGLSLPFISYGGSALIVNMIAVGLLINISKEKPAEAL